MLDFPLSFQRKNASSTLQRSTSGTLPPVQRYGNDPYIWAQKWLRNLHEVRPWSYTGTHRYSMGKASVVSSSEEEKNTRKFSYKMFRKNVFRFSYLLEIFGLFETSLSLCTGEGNSKKRQGFGPIWVYNRTWNFYKPFFITIFFQTSPSNHFPQRCGEAAFYWCPLYNSLTLLLWCFWQKRLPSSGLDFRQISLFCTDSTTAF